MEYFSFLAIDILLVLIYADIYRKWEIHSEITIRGQPIFGIRPSS